MPWFASACAPILRRADTARSRQGFVDHADRDGHLLL
jgi:hypothetical protein